MDYIARPTWHVYDDCTLKVFERQRQVLALELTPSEAIKLGADLIIAARRMQSSAPS